MSRIVSTVAGNGSRTEVEGTGADAHFNYPSGLAMLNGAIWVANFYGYTIRQIGILSCFTNQVSRYSKIYI